MARGGAPYPNFPSYLRNDVGLLMFCVSSPLGKHPF
jgi:hypothetical protein